VGPRPWLQPVILPARRTDAKHFPSWVRLKYYQFTNHPSALFAHSDSEISSRGNSDARCVKTMSAAKCNASREQRSANKQAASGSTPSRSLSDAPLKATGTSGIVTRPRSAVNACALDFAGCARCGIIEGASIRNLGVASSGRYRQEKRRLSPAVAPAKGKPTMGAPSRLSPRRCWHCLRWTGHGLPRC
jgi:hypothetical protein